MCQYLHWFTQARIWLFSIDLTQITLGSELLSQISGWIVVLRDQIHKELGNLINLIRVIKLGWLSLNVNKQVVSKVVARLIWLGFDH